MAKTQTDRAVIDLVINGQQSKASLKEVTLEATRARSALLKMKEADDPAAYQQKLRDYQALNKAQREMTGRINETSTAWSRFKTNAASTMAGVIGGDLVSTAFSAVTGGISKAITSYREFNAASQELSAVTGATGKDLAYLNQEAARTGPSVGKSGAEMLEAYKLMASAKPELLAQKELLVQTTQAALTLAQAGKIDLAEATSVTAESLNEFGASADQANRFINVIAAGAKEGSAEIADMGVALKNTGTVAAAQGVSFEQTNAVLQSLSTIALKGGEAGTQLRNVLLTLGAGSDDTNPRVVGLEKALENLGKKNLSTAEMTKLFGKENITAAQHIIAHRDEIAELTTKVTGSQEAFSQAATNNKSLDHQLEVFWARVEGLAVSLGTSLIPAFTKVVEWATTLTDVLNTAVTPASDAAAMAFQDQKTKVMELNQSLSPLLTRHDQLTAKTILTKEEQAELKKIVGEVANIVPSAVTEFDKYGNALGINTEKAREFIRVQQAMLKVKNEEAIRTQTDALKDDEKQLAENMAYRKKATTGAWDVIQATQDELRELDNQNAELAEKIKGRKALLKDLSGENLKVPTITPSGTPKATSTGGPDGKGGGKPAGPSEEETKEKEKAKRLADAKVTANKRADLAIEEMQVNAIKDEEKRDLAQVQLKADREKEEVRTSAANAEKKKVWIAGIEDALAVEKHKIYEKYEEKRQKEEAERLKNIKAAAEEELRVTRDLKKSEIESRVAAGGLTKEQGKQAELQVEATYLKARELLYSQHFEALANAAVGNKDLMADMARDAAKESADIDSGKTKNEGDQATARRDIRQADLENDLALTEKKKQHAQEEKEFRVNLANQALALMSNNWSQTIASYKDYWKQASLIQKAALVAQKAWAIAEIAINLARQISLILTASSVMNSVIPGSGIGTAVIGIAKAVGQAAVQTGAVLGVTMATPGFADGGFTGSGDGPSGYVNSPTLFTMGRRRYIAGEAGREFVISNRALQNPVVADFTRMMDVAQKTGNYSQLGGSGGDYSSGAFGIGSDTKEATGMSQELGMAILTELRLNRSSTQSKNNQNVALNYRLFEQYRDNLQAARIENKL
ncbi:phage tail tape measure protein [Spirosoma aureum]|uniref:Phage tail tape measure protein n=1 Tax=Spirosoma aureum TaxID=2692134 RepID=A0A6G9ATJ5_9BACT|nr:phage tail tape measure protein [Spirosoma aureum]QIP15708.1 phage tail tape measure protein [Spirosoma aureum]